MPFVNFWKKFRCFSFDFRQNFDVRTFPRWLSRRGTKFFWWAIQKFCFFQNLHFGPGRFLKIWIIYSQICILIWYFWVFLENYSMRMLSIRRNDFIACWASVKLISLHTEHTRHEFPRMLSHRISSHAEHAWNRFHRMLSMRGNV
jgi:hypothetical protein